MNGLLHDFVVWFAKFLAVSVVLIIAVHLLGRRWARGSDSECAAPPDNDASNRVDDQITDLPQ